MPVWRGAAQFRFGETRATVADRGFILTLVMHSHNGGSSSIVVTGWETDETGPCCWMSHRRPKRKKSNVRGRKHHEQTDEDLTFDQSSKPWNYDVSSMLVEFLL